MGKNEIYMASLAALVGIVTSAYVSHQHGIEAGKREARHDITDALQEKALHYGGKFQEGTRIFWDGRF